MEREDAARGSDELAPTEAAPTPRSAAAGVSLALPNVPSDLRYDRRRVLGRGGMGEVRLCRDERIGRDVALKVALGGSGADPRFVREALLQARLEHPAFVPVYDVATDPEGQPYFTMRRIRGRTLRDVLASLAEGDEATRARFTRHRLLSALVQIALAIDYAHEHGVVHRDVKPENIMLGDFGEVYLLDWGIAKVDGEADPLVRAPGAAPDAVGHTAQGAVLGTVGYMAPEQVRGQTVDRRTDVYALGVTLYEILAGEPLHRGPMAAILESTLSGESDRAPSSRAGANEIAPELDALVERATDADPERRFASARELADAIERFLDGDRDAALRRAHAEERAERAAALLREAGADAAARADAGREAVRALAFDVDNRDARSTLVAVLTEPAAPPPQALADVGRSHAKTASEVYRLYAYGLLSVGPLVLVLVLASGVVDWTAFLVSGGAAVACGLYFLTVARTGRMGDRVVTLGFLLACGASAVFSRWLSPWITIPMMLVVNLIGVTYFGSVPHKVLRAISAALAMIVPLALEQAGWIEPSWALREGAMVILPRMSELHWWTPWIVLAHAVTTIMLAPWMFWTVLDRARAIEVRFHAQSWIARRMVDLE